MTDDQVQMTLFMACSVLANTDASADRKAWAEDAIKALEHGDIAAARRIGLFDVPERRAAA
jgi:hypothetical protein